MILCGNWVYKPISEKFGFSQLFLELQKLPVSFGTLHLFWKSILSFEIHILRKELNGIRFLNTTCCLLLITALYASRSVQFIQTEDINERVSAVARQIVSLTALQASLYHVC